LRGFAAVGDNCIDRFLAPVGRWLVGGNAVNVAVQLARMGESAAYFGAVGDDDNGRRVLAALASAGVDTISVRVAEGRTTAFTDLVFDASGDRVIAYEDFGACRDYRSSNEDRARLFAAVHVHLGWLADGGELRRALAGRGVSASQDVSVNAGPDHLGVEGLSVAFASAGGGFEEARGVAARLVAGGAKLAVVTCGALGSFAADETHAATMDALPVEVVDTTGAGDSFIAGFLRARARGFSLVECLASGRDAAAAACRHLGGFPQPALPLAGGE